MTPRTHSSPCVGPRTWVDPFRHGARIATMKRAIQAAAAWSLYKIHGKRPAGNFTVLPTQFIWRDSLTKISIQLNLSGRITGVDDASQWRRFA